jgi:TonB family protein
MVAGGQAALKTTVFFRVLKDGTIGEAWVETSSGLIPFDRAALTAVLDASPIEPLPELFKSDHLGVYFDFEY